MIGLFATSKSFTPFFIGCPDDSSFFPQNRKSGFYTIKILTTYTTKMQLHGPDELGLLQYISEWARTTDHPGCNNVLNLHSDLELESASTDGRHLILFIRSLPNFDVETNVT